MWIDWDLTTIDFSSIDLLQTVSAGSAIDLVKGRKNTSIVIQADVINRTLIRSLIGLQTITCCYDGSVVYYV